MTTFSDGRVVMDVALTDSPTGGSGPVPSTLVSLATTNVLSIKNSKGRIYNIIAWNGNAADRYLKVFNKASAQTMAVDTPVLNILLPKSFVPVNLYFGDIGVLFPLGIQIAITANQALLDNTAIGAGDVTLNLAIA